MSRIALPPLVSPQLFRHFAVITVALTACIGLIADGESREAIRDEFAEREARNQVLKTEKQKLGKRTINLRSRPEKYRARAPDESGPDIPVDAGGYSGGGGDGDYSGSGYTGFGPPPSYETVPTADPWANQPISGREGAPGTPPVVQKKKPPFKPSPEDIQRTIAEARARSGGDDSDDY